SPGELKAISGSASTDKNGILHLSLVNIDLRHQQLDIDIKGRNIKTVKARILTSDKVQDHNSFTEPNKIAPRVFNDFALKDHILSFKMPAFSTIVFELL
ncbi:MAG TPA: alpha-L-arabinofuranosidase C-terminal domain-containing protein, partial [Flavisolibacter sp.]|nr:alpha-L-arabinofuranosidase C-terminal domain-containing protein [Flavisolibacter sp.]